MKNYCWLIIALIITFNAQAKQSFSKQITVDRKGTGDFTSLQEAINTVRAFDPDGGQWLFVVTDEPYLSPLFVVGLLGERYGRLDVGEYGVGDSDGFVEKEIG